MNKVLKYVPYIVILLIAIVAAVTRPWQYFNFVPVIGQNSALTVKTIAGKGEVYLNDKKIGETPLSSENLTPGDYDLKIHRVSETEDFYEDLILPIHLETNTRTFVEAEIGPDEQFSSVIILYYKKNKNDMSGLYLDSIPQDATIWIDDIKEGSTPLTTNKLKDGKHELKISAEGYEDITTNLIIRKGFTLIADIRLMSKPIEIE